ncbi:Hypothetical protein, putative [Bodo saltans]|uniref:ER membrane protein complex subunit 1 n=1 Tax=Bodo saltans TaxID=75058 RepID=A0A0S4KM87_BODSA|nr:Hypothetical protein, putative [Bodo saltans]|eukprot:CUI15612.1 Hypothetical protein, putative [Bodo saltans]
MQTKLLLASIVVVAVTIAAVNGILHEDEIGKRDWRLAGVGRLEQAAIINTPTAKQTMVSTKKGVVAALATLDKGTIRWRHVLGEPQVCLSANAKSTLVMDKRGVGHVFHTVTGSLVTAFSVNLESRTLADCFLDSARGKGHAHVVAFSGSTVVYEAFSLNDDASDLEARPVELTNIIETSSAVTAVKLAGDVNIWIERNGTGVDVVALQGDKKKQLTKTDTMGYLGQTSPTGDAFLSFYKGETGPKNSEAGRLVRIMSAENGVIKSKDEKKGTSCQACRTGLSVLETAATKEGAGTSTTGDVVLTIRESEENFFLHVASKRFTVAYRGHFPPAVIAARQTDKKAEVLLRTDNNHILFVTASLDDEAATVAWERFEGITAPAQVKIVRLGDKSLVSAEEEADHFGFNVDAIVLSTYGTLYRVPVANNGSHVQVIADVSATLRKVLDTTHTCGTQYKELVISDDGIATIVAQYGAETVLINVELSTGIVTSTSGPVVGATLQSPNLLLDADFKLAVGTPSVVAQYFYKVDQKAGKLSGLKLPAGASTAIPTWEVSLGSIVSVAAPKDKLTVLTTEYLRVFPNTSKINEVRRKYPTQNIVAVATQSAEDDVLTVFIVDTITGNILASVQHQEARAPVHMIIVEHVVVYHFLNTDRMRYALGVLELFEREEVIVSDATTASPAQAVASFFVSQKTFSSLTARPPVVASMVLAFPGGALSAVGVTTSYLGINRKQLLFALANGHVHAVDLRAVCFGGQVNPQKPEEVFQHVMLPSINIVSHIMEVAQPRLIVSTPTELESSAHVVVAGLDLFYTRVSAGKAYDMVNEDFNHTGLMLVCGVMGVLSIVTRYFAGRKALKNNWA